MFKSKLIRTSIAGIILALIACFILPLVPVSTGASRYFVMGQVFVADGTTTTDSAGRQVADKTITVTGGAGNFTIFMTEGITGTVTSGTAAITGSPVTLVAGLNTLVADGNGDCALDITIGTAANTDTVNNWSAASGGTGGASVPTSADDVFFDALSFTGAGQIATINATLTTKDMDWTGATNTPTLAGSSIINLYGNLTTILGMVWSHTAEIRNQATNKTITTNGLSISSQIVVQNKITFLDNFTTTNAYITVNGNATLDTNGKTVNANRITFNQVSSHTITLGNSIINCTGWYGINSAGGSLTITSNTSTINISGTGVFYHASGVVTGSYYNVNLIGTTHTISGSNTFAELNLASGTTQTITFTDGTTQTVTTANLSGSAGHIHTLQGSSTAGWNIVKAGSGYVSADYLSISRSTATPTPNIWYAGANSIDSLNNSGWYFTVPAVPTVTTQDASSIQIFAATGNGNITDAGAGNIATDRGFDWGLISGVYIDDVTEAGSFGVGAFTNTIEVLDDNTTIFYRAKAQNPAGWGYGGELSFVTGNLAGLLTLAQNGDNQVDLTWTTDPSVAATEIRRAVGDYPATQADGVQVYLGAGTSYTDNADEVGLELDKSIYYYRAWYQNGDGDWSSTYAESNIGGLMTNTILLGILILFGLCLTIGGYALHRGSLAFTSMAVWMVTCVWAYIEAAGEWGIYMGLFWISIAMIITSGMEGVFLNKGEEKAEEQVQYTEALDKALEDMDTKIDARKTRRNNLF